MWWPFVALIWIACVVTYMLIGIIIYAILNRDDLRKGQKDLGEVGMCAIFWPIVLMAVIIVGIGWLMGRIAEIIARIGMKKAP